MPNVSDNCELELGAGAGDVARVAAVPGSQGLSNTLLVAKQTADDASSKLMRAVQSSKLGGKLSGAVGKVGSAMVKAGETSVEGKVNRFEVPRIHHFAAYGHVDRELCCCCTAKHCLV